MRLIARLRREQLADGAHRLIGTRSGDALRLHEEPLEERALARGEGDDKERVAHERIDLGDGLSEEMREAITAAARFGDHRIAEKKREEHRPERRRKYIGGEDREMQPKRRRACPWRCGSFSSLEDREEALP